MLGAALTAQPLIRRQRALRHCASACATTRTHANRTSQHQPLSMPLPRPCLASSADLCFALPLFSFFFSPSGLPATDQSAPSPPVDLDQSWHRSLSTSPSPDPSLRVDSAHGVAVSIDVDQDSSQKSRPADGGARSSQTGRAPSRGPSREKTSSHGQTGPSGRHRRANDCLRRVGVGSATAADGHHCARKRNGGKQQGSVKKDKHPPAPRPERQHNAEAPPFIAHPPPGRPVRTHARRPLSLFLLLPSSPSAHAVPLSSPPPTSALRSRLAATTRRGGRWSRSRVAPSLSGPRRLPGPAQEHVPTLTKRRTYLARLAARPVGGLEVRSCLATLGVWPRTLPARAREPWTLPARRNGERNASTRVPRHARRPQAPATMAASYAELARGRAAELVHRAA